MQSQVAFRARENNKMIHMITNRLGCKNPRLGGLVAFLLGCGVLWLKFGWTPSTGTLHHSHLLITGPVLIVWGLVAMFAPGILFTPTLQCNGRLGVQRSGRIIVLCVGVAAGWMISHFIFHSI
jgi:hypothetical protein